VPKPAHLRSVDLVNPAPAAQDATPRASGEAVETVPKAGRRRSFSAAEKLRIVQEAESRAKQGTVGAFLRSEGVYSSQLCKWRKQLDLRGKEALEAQKRGPKPKLDEKDRRIAEQDKRIAKLEAKLALNAQLLELQKKVASILGFELESDEKP
jgi:transposase